MRERTNQQDFASIFREQSSVLSSLLFSSVLSLLSHSFFLSFSTARPGYPRLRFDITSSFFFFLFFFFQNERERAKRETTHSLQGNLFRVSRRSVVIEERKEEKEEIKFFPFTHRAREEERDK